MFVRVLVRLGLIYTTATQTNKTAMFQADRGLFFTHVPVPVVVPDLSFRFSNGYLGTGVSSTLFLCHPLQRFSFYLKAVTADRKEREGTEESVHCSEAPTQRWYMWSRMGKNLIKCIQYLEAWEMYPNQVTAQLKSVTVKERRKRL